ncbi:hypothetical protein ZIOFF_072516 [Zingiber officinale]|uniref:Flap endonuclease 1 n=1 Tax=Zingiber officinale TaxID=94328 RepID=A0A8J5BYY1_ZINOF|nr:hypothetical protein ZIOFF_072516 [Zingiber officinale]
MGIKGLTKLIAENAPGAIREQTFESYSGRWIALDASMSIYQFLAVVRRNGVETLTNEAGEVTSHLQGMLNRTTRLLQAEIMPAHVKRLDAMKDLTTAMENGNDDEIKKFSKRTIKMTKRHNEDCKRLLRLMGVPVIEISGSVPRQLKFHVYAKAPCEAEAQCAALCKAGKVYAVASEDMDSLTFGAPRFVRHLTDPSSRRIPVIEFQMSKTLEELKLTMEQFIDLCILSGCDYCDSIRGIGGQTALKLIRRHGCLENILQNINKERYRIPKDWPYPEVRQLFQEPTVSLETPELKLALPDEEGLLNFLVNENSFNKNRVAKACTAYIFAIERMKGVKNLYYQEKSETFFKPVLSASLPLKTKERKCLVHLPRARIKSGFMTAVDVSVICSSKMNSLPPVRALRLPSSTPAHLGLGL